MAYRWTILAVGSLATGVLGALRMGLPAIAPALRDAYALSLSEVGVVLAATGAGIMVGLVPLGALADRRGERPVLAIGLSATAVVLALTAAADGLATWCAGLFAAGFLASAATGGSGRAVMGWFGRRERGFALGVRQTAIPLGGFVAALVLPALASWRGVDAALLALAGAFAVAAAACALWLRDPPERELGPAALAALADTPPPLEDRRLWRLAGASALLVVAQATLLGYLVLFLHDERGLSASAAAAVLAAIQLGGAAARLVVGRWSDRLGRRIAPMRVIALGAGVALAGAAALAAAPIPLLVPVLIVAGTLAMTWNGLSVTAAAELAGRARAGTAMSAQNAAVTAAGAVSVSGFGALVGLAGWRAALLATSAAPLAGRVLLHPLVGEEDSRARRRAAAILQDSSTTPRPQRSIT